MCNMFTFNIVSHYFQFSFSFQDINIVDYNVMHTMTCRIINSMHQILINIIFYYFS